MRLAVLRSRALAGMEAPAVSVEVHLANGLPVQAQATARQCSAAACALVLHLDGEQVGRRGLPDGPERDLFRFPALLRQGRAAFAQTGDNRRPPFPSPTRPYTSHE